MYSGATYLLLSPEAQGADMETLFLKKGEERRLRAGHLWVFSNEVDVRRSPLSSFEPGQDVLVADAQGHVLGTAYVNPASLITARLVSREKRPLDAGLLRERLMQALSLRERLFDRPFYRLCHGEGDFLPGLVLDRHGDWLTAQITTAGMERHREDLAQILEDMLKPRGCVLANDIASRDLEGLPRREECLWGDLADVPPETGIEENGLKYRIPLTGGQKTGWFYDQRPNRAALAALAGGADFLDAFCYAGGFGALAAARGAKSVTFLDASASALEFARGNAAQAGLDNAEALKGDALTLLADLRREERRFDIVCLDPPAFIKRRKDARQGLEAYRRVNELGLDLVRPGGLLMSCSCSHHLEASELLRLVARAAGRRGRHLRLLFQGFQGPDHPVHPSMPETAYLKTFLFQAD